MNKQIGHTVSVYNRYNKLLSKKYFYTFDLALKEITEKVIEQPDDNTVLLSYEA